MNATPRDVHSPAQLPTNLNHMVALSIPAANPPPSLLNHHWGEEWTMASTTMARRSSFCLTAEHAPMAEMEEKGPLLRGGPPPHSLGVNERTVATVRHPSPAVSVDGPKQHATHPTFYPQQPLDEPSGTAKSDPIIHTETSELPEALPPNAWTIDDDDDDFLDLGSPPDDGTTDNDEFGLNLALVGTTTDLASTEGASTFLLSLASSSPSGPWEQLFLDRPEHCRVSKVSIDASIVSVDGSRSDDAHDTATAALALREVGTDTVKRPTTNGLGVHLALPH